jgi:hypothetical protein
MNERIKELAEQAGWMMGDEVEGFNTRLEKFAEFLLEKCISLAHEVGDLRGANDDMIFGADTAAVRIAQYFQLQKQSETK